MDNNINQNIQNLTSENLIKSFLLFAEIMKSNKSDVNKLEDFKTKLKEVKFSNQNLIKTKGFDTWSKLKKDILNKWSAPFWNSKVLDFLSLYTTVAIPRYQRNYQWKKQTIHKFLNSLTHQGNFNLGISILYEPKKDFSKIEIVDGQQRITTILIFTLCYYKYIVNENKDFEIIKETLKNFGFNFIVTDDKKDSGIHKTITDVITANNFIDSENKEKMAKMIDFGETEEYFNSWIEEYPENAEKAFLNLKNIKFIFKKTNNLSQAYEDFYNVNNISEKLTNWDNIRSIFYIRKYHEVNGFEDFIKCFDKILELNTVKNSGNPKNKALTIFGILVNNKFYTTNTSFAKIEEILISPNTNKEEFLKEWTEKLSNYIEIEQEYKNLKKNQKVALELAKIHAPDNYFELLVINFISNNKKDISLKDALSFTADYFDRRNKDTKWASNEFRNRINQLFKEKGGFDPIISNLYEEVKIIPNSFRDDNLKKPSITTIQNQIKRIFEREYSENWKRKYSLLINAWDYDFKHGIDDNEMTDEHLFSKSNKYTKIKIDVDSNWNQLPMEKYINTKLGDKSVCSKSDYLLNKCDDSENIKKHKLIANKINEICKSSNKNKDKKISEYLKNRHTEINQKFIEELKK